MRLLICALLLTVVIFCLSAATFAQGYSSKGVLQLIDLKYGVKTDTMQICSKYMINGVPFEGLVLEQELMKRGQGSIGFVTFEQPANGSNQTNCKWVIWIYTKDSQTELEKERLLLQAKGYFQAAVPDLTDGNFKCQLCKSFLLDNTLYQNNDIKAVLSQLQARDVAYIAWYTHPVNPALYGTTAVNGMVEIIMNPASVQRNVK